MHVGVVAADVLLRGPVGHRPKLQGRVLLLGPLELGQNGEILECPPQGASGSRMSLSSLSILGATGRRLSPEVVLTLAPCDPQQEALLFTHHIPSQLSVLVPISRYTYTYAYTIRGNVEIFSPQYGPITVKLEKTWATKGPLMGQALTLNLLDHGRSQGRG